MGGAAPPPLRVTPRPGETKLVRMRRVIQVALFGVACGIPISGKKQHAEQKLIVTSEDACPKYVSLTGNDGGRLQVDDSWCEGNCRDRPLCPKDKCTCFTEHLHVVSGQEEAASADLRKAMVKEKVAAPVAAPVATPEGGALPGSCPKFVGRGSSADGNPRLKGYSSTKEDEYCEKNCRKGFCPETTCRCSTDVLAEPSDESAEAAVAELPVAPLPVAPVAPVAPQVLPTAPVAANCPNYVGLTTVANVWAPKRHEPGHTKTKVKKIDDGYCERNCRKGFCPQDKCRCETDPEPVQKSADPENDAIAKRMAADPHAAAPDDSAAAAVPHATAKDGCPSYVSNLASSGDKKGPFKSVDDEYCEKNCRVGFCPEDSCRCSTEPAPAGAAAAAAEPEEPVDWRKTAKTTNQKSPAIAKPVPWWKTAKASNKKAGATGEDSTDDAFEGAEVYEEGADSDGPTK